LKVTLPATPFELPPKPRELTAAPSSHLLAVRKVDPILLADEGREFTDVMDGSTEVPMGKRSTWVTPTPTDYDSESEDI